MERTLTDEICKTCFVQLGLALLLFARRLTNFLADAEDIVQDAFVRFWRRQHSIQNRALLYATVRSIGLDLLRRDARRARREAAAVLESDQTIEPYFANEDESQRALAKAVDGLPQE